MKPIVVKITYKKTVCACFCYECRKSHYREIYAEDYERDDRCNGWAGIPPLLVQCVDCERQDLEKWRTT